MDTMEGIMVCIDTMQETLVYFNMTHPASKIAIMDMLVAASSKLHFCVTVHLALILQTHSVSM